MTTSLVPHAAALSAQGIGAARRSVAEYRSTAYCGSGGHRWHRRGVMEIKMHPELEDMLIVADASTKIEKIVGHPVAALVVCVILDDSKNDIEVFKKRIRKTYSLA